MVKEDYKETEIGVIPKDWTIDSITNICDYVDYRGKTPKKTSKGIFLVTAKNVKAGYIDYECSREYVSDDEYDLVMRRGLPSLGDVLITTEAPCGNVAQVDKINIALAQRIVKYSSKTSRLTNDYLKYYFLSETFQGILTNTISGGTVKGIKGSVLHKLPVIIPLQNEQQKIAEALSDMDNLISSLEKLIEKKKAIKQGAMQKLLTGKTRLPGFSGEWQDVTLGDCCEIYDGTHQTPNYTEYGMPFYSVENVTADDFVNTKYISFEEHELLNKNRRMEKGDVLMTRIGSIGDCKYIDWDVNASFYVSLALIKCKKKISGQFLSYYSHTEKFKKEIEIRSLLTAIPQKINLGPISEIVINVPADINEQNAITEIIFDMDNEISTLEQKLAKCQKLKQGMMQQLLTGKIRLVSNNDVVTDKPEADTLKVSPKGHNHQFDDAVVIAGIVDKFYSDKYPLGRKKVQKLLYLFRRHQEADTSAFKKKAAGPYADEVRYKGGEPIAISSKYISVKKGAKGSSFSKGEKIADALTYLENWNLIDNLKWLCEQFKYIKTDKLELLATIDMAMCDLYDAGITVTVDSIKNLIKSHSEWKEKLSKSYFKDNDIAWAIKECRRLFG